MCVCFVLHVCVDICFLLPAFNKDNIEVTNSSEIFG